MPDALTPACYAKASEVFADCPLLGPAARSVALDPLPPQPDPFRSLVRAVVFQQLSGKAAEAIHNKFLTLFPGPDYPTPAEIARLDVETLREKGLSRPKAAYILDLADKVQRRELHLDRLSDMADDEVRAEITQVKGFGVWSADMFLIFSLHRPDVWPTLDLGVRNGYRRLAQWDQAPSPKELAPLGDRYRPYRTLASLLLWRVLEPGFQLVV